MDKFLHPPIHDVMGAMPAAALIGAGVLFAVGLVVWLMGQKLARPVCVLTGLILGGVGGLAGGHALGEQAYYVLPMVVGCAVAGALLAALLFRLWVALAGAVLLSLIVPAGSLMWHGTPLPGQGKSVVNATQPTGSVANRQSQAARPKQAGAKGESASTQPTAQATFEKTYRAVVGFYGEEVSGIQQWWDNGLDGGGRRLVYLGAAAGALIGLVFGLVAPYVAASLESALAGAILLFFPGSTLLEHFSPGKGALIPSSPRSVIFALCLITVIGFLFQWTLFRRSADK